MKVRKTTLADVDAVLAIIQEAQEYFRASGIPQWQNGYPNRASVLSDIEQGISYLLENDAGAVVGTSVLQFTPEPTYEIIREGQWLTGDGYAAIHRVAVAGSAKGTGAAGFLYSRLEQVAREAGVPSVRVDTHRVNAAMQGFLKKNGFEYCGLVYMADGAERVAFEKLL